MSGTTVDTVEALEASLAHLERLQTQLETLRSTVPTLVSPLIKPQTSKAQMFAQVKKSAVTTTSQLAAFREDWNSEQTQQILAKAQESEQKDPDLSKAEDVARFGWIKDYEKEDS